MFGAAITIMAQSSPVVGWSSVIGRDNCSLDPIAATVSSRLLHSWESGQLSVSYERKGSKRQACFHVQIHSLFSLVQIAIFCMYSPNQWSDEAKSPYAQKHIFDDATIIEKSLNILQLLD